MTQRMAQRMAQLRSGARYSFVLHSFALLACAGSGDGDVLQGQVEVRKVNVSSKIAGRLDSILVREGDTVGVGQLVAVLRSPELAAKAPAFAGAQQ